jgi:pimeloyl-ACP methyl ester carboxylesterase
VRDAFVRAYTGRDALRCGFGYYRAAAQNADAVRAAGRLHVPTLTLGAAAVGDRLYRQLQPITDDLEGEVVAGSGHLVPLDRPDVVAAHLRAEPPAVTASPSSGVVGVRAADTFGGEGGPPRRERRG